MGRRFYSIEEYSNAVDSAVREILGDDNSAVHRGMRETIAQMAEREVYSYQPKFNSRRKYDGGLIDPDNIIATQSGTKGFTVTFTMVAPWQQLYGGVYPEQSLAEVIENPRGGHMYGAAARQFTGWAEVRYDDHYLETSGKGGQALKYEMEMRGF